MNQEKIEPCSASAPQPQAPPGIGSGWQQSQQNWLPPAVMGADREPILLLRAQLHVHGAATVAVLSRT